MRIRNFSYAWCLILTRILFSMVSPGWLGVWVGLEINLFGALLFLVNNKKQTVTRGYKYFYIQSLGSRVIVIRIVAGG